MPSRMGDDSSPIGGVAPLVIKDNFNGLRLTTTSWILEKERLDVGAVATQRREHHDR